MARFYPKLSKFTSIFAKILKICEIQYLLSNPAAFDYANLSAYWAMDFCQR